MNYEVKNYIYNGLFVTEEKGLASYTAEFVEWTRDPGVATCKCSDGKMRNIPTCALKGFSSKDYPKQVYGKEKVIFGVPSSS